MFNISVIFLTIEYINYYISNVKVRTLYDERAILVRIVQGDQQAFQMLFNHYQNKVFGYALKLLGSEVAAEEVVQNVFIKIWLNRGSLNNIENFGGYIRTVTRNHTLNELKRIARETLALAIKNQDWADADFNTENQIIYKDTHRVLQRALETLPPQQKLVYSMCKVEGMKYDEVAQKLCISPLTVKAHLKQAAKSVKSYLLVNMELIYLLILFSYYRLK